MALFAGVRQFPIIFFCLDMEVVRGTPQKTLASMYNSHAQFTWLSGSAILTTGNVVPLFVKFSCMCNPSDQVAALTFNLVETF